MHRRPKIVRTVSAENRENRNLDKITSYNVISREDEMQLL